MDRTTLGRTILPLERDGLVAIARGRDDRRRKELQMTDAGLERLRVANKYWASAQQRFEAGFGSSRAAELRGLLHSVVATELKARRDPS